MDALSGLSKEDGMSASNQPEESGFNVESAFEAAEDEALWELLSVYADGEASPEEAARAESLLRSDAAVAQKFEFLQWASRAAQSVDEVEPPASLRESILATTSHRPTLARRLAAAWSEMRAGAGRYALPVGALAAASVLAVVFWPRSASAPRSATHFKPNQVAQVDTGKRGSEPSRTSESGRASGTPSVAVKSRAAEIAKATPAFRAKSDAQSESRWIDMAERAREEIAASLAAARPVDSSHRA